MTSITARNAAALVERNGSSLPEVASAPTRKARGKKAPAPAAVAPGNDPAPVAEGNDPAPTPVGAACLCGCSETAAVGRSYRPGHDARHAGAVARRVVAGAPGADAELAALAPALQEKARRFVSNRAAESARKEAAARVRAEAKAALKAALAAI